MLCINVQAIAQNSLTKMCQQIYGKIRERKKFSGEIAQPDYTLLNM